MIAGHVSDEWPLRSRETLAELLVLFASMSVSRIRKLDPGRFERDLIKAKHTVETFAELLRVFNE